MRNEADFILQNIHEMTKDINEDDNFQSTKDKVYRCEAIRTIFLGLYKDQQDRALQFLLSLLVQQKTESTLKIVGGTN
ncbi:MAG: hypothetical protein E6935_06515 [Clostridium butyricum]|uniref:hypothetical protein n=1 Tax=Clostridium butyricum TaxID=1492 RepID=UPI0018A90C57|nr:hypothetical protein [Clostridium butyricum]MDB2157726.1 hypothetical protein [Clostridium butyricum]MDU1337848.1 hypothetical protein [Clostridium butyricum]